MSLNALSAVAVPNKRWRTCVKIPAVGLLPYFAARHFAPIRSSSVATNWGM